MTGAHSAAFFSGRGEFAILVALLGAFAVSCANMSNRAGRTEDGPITPDQVTSMVIYSVDPAWGAEIVAVEAEHEHDIWVTVRESKRRESAPKPRTYHSVYGLKVSQEDTARIVENVLFEKPRWITPFFQGAYLAIGRLADGSEVRMQINIIGDVEYGYKFCIFGQKGYYRTQGASSEAIVDVMNRFVQGVQAPPPGD